MGVEINMKKIIICSILLLTILIIISFFDSRIIKTTDLGIVNEFEIINDTIYYIDRNNNSLIHKSNSEDKISQNSAFSIEGYQGNIYFINMDDNYYIYEINLKTKITKVIVQNTAKKMKIKDGFIYFISGHNEYIYRVNIDGGDKIQIIDESCLDFTIENETIYYMYREKNDFSGYYFSKSNIQGNNRKKIINEPINAVDFDDNWIYYSVSDEKKIYKVRHDGTEKTKLVDAASYYLKLVDKKLFFLQDGINTGIYIIDTNKNHFEKVEEDSFLWVDCFDNYLIYRGLSNRKTNIIEINEYHKTSELSTLF